MPVIRGYSGKEAAGIVIDSRKVEPGDIFVAICLLFFAFSTILGWHFFGAVNVKYLFGDFAVKVYSCVVIICIIVGSTLKVDLVWELSDFFNGMMVIPNALALLALTGVVVANCKKYSGK